MRTFIVAYGTERFVGWVDFEGPTSKTSVLNLSPRMSEVTTVVTQVVTTVSVTQVRDVTQVVGGAMVVLTQTYVGTVVVTLTITQPMGCRLRWLR